MNEALQDAFLWLQTRPPDCTIASLRDRANSDPATRRIFNTMTIAEFLFEDAVPPVESGPLDSLDAYVESVRTALRSCGAIDERVISEVQLLERVGGDPSVARQAIKELVEGCSILSYVGGFYALPVQVRAGWPRPPARIDGRELRPVSALNGEPIPSSEGP